MPGVGNYVTRGSDGQFRSDLGPEGIANKFRTSVTLESWSVVHNDETCLYNKQVLSGSLCGY